MQVRNQKFFRAGAGVYIMNCLHHELIIAKLDVYGFDIKSVKLIQQYLSNRKQMVKVGNAYSSWKETFYGILQG